MESVGGRGASKGRVGPARRLGGHGRGHSPGAAHSPASLCLWRGGGGRNVIVTATRNSRGCGGSSSCRGLIVGGGGAAALCLGSLCDGLWPSAEIDSSVFLPEEGEHRVPPETELLQLFDRRNRHLGVGQIAVLPVEEAVLPRQVPRAQLPEGEEVAPDDDGAVGAGVHEQSVAGECHTPDDFVGGEEGDHVAEGEGRAHDGAVDGGEDEEDVGLQHDHRLLPLIVVADVHARHIGGADVVQVHR
mmetsp:Transcript_13006/g.51866  ORF Transcript_13006/g.51866 Transcript_13006/m.51866 type:complete len:245 (+) Transcript_13006:38-772(+)